MAQSKIYYRVALAGYYGFGNLGDELLAEAAVASLLRCGLERKDIVMLSAAPEESKRKFGVDAVNRWSFLQICRALRQSETLLFGGGGLFQDATSLRSCLYYWWLARAARFLGAMPWALGQSVGPLSTRAGRTMARDALSLCRTVQVRDQASLSLCESLGLSAEMGEDLTLSLGDSFTRQNENDSALTSRLLINLRPHSLAESFAEAVSVYAASFSGDVVGLSMSEEDGRLLERFAHDGRLPLSRIERVSNLPGAVRALRGACAVGMRLHFAILAAMAGIPLTVAPYDPKVESFAAAHNIPVWRKGALPAPRGACLPRNFSLRARKNVDRLCRSVLNCKGTLFF